MEQIATSTPEILYYTLTYIHSMQKSLQQVISHHGSLFLLNRFRTVQNTAFDRYTSTYYVKQFNYPTTHPVFISPASEKWLKYSTAQFNSISALLKKIKSSMSETFEKRGQHVIYRRDRLVVLYFTGKFE